MQYFLETGQWRSVFAVPKDLVDKHIKLAGKEQLKTILWMLCHNESPASAQEIAAAVGISAENAEDAIQYWLNCGFISPAEPAASPRQETAAARPAAPAKEKKEASAPAEKPALSPRKNLIKPDGHYVATRIQESPALQYLMQESQMVLGKTLSPALSSALVAIHEDYGLPAEVIMMLIQYAKSRNKTSTNYIEAVARDWYESNIFTLESAEQKLAELSEMRIAWKKFVAAIGIHDRPPSKKEEQLTHTWFTQWKMAPEMVSEAYERCVNATGKLSMAYMNRILEKWHNLGYHTVQDVQKAEELRREKFTEEKSYDIDKLEKTGFFDPVEEF